MPDRVSSCPPPQSLNTLCSLSLHNDTTKKEKEEGILERMLESLEYIGQNVERIMYRSHLYNAGTEQRNHDEWMLDELYNNENGDY
jgi:histidinol phosphatase-like enzyme